MAKPNYQYEKRQRELAKKQKKEEKLRRKASGSDAPGEQGVVTDSTGAASTDGGQAAPVDGQSEMETRR